MLVSIRWFPDVLIRLDHRNPPYYRFDSTKTNHPKRLCSNRTRLNRNKKHTGAFRTLISDSVVVSFEVFAVTTRTKTRYAFRKISTGARSGFRPRPPPRPRDRALYIVQASACSKSDGSTVAQDRCDNKAGL